MKSIKMFGKSVPLLAIIIASMLAIGASAILLTSYGTVLMNANTVQSVTIDSAGDTIVGIGGNTYCFPHVITNLAEVPAGVAFETVDSIDASNPNGITTSYYEPVEYSYPATLHGTVKLVTVTVTDTDDGYLKWTYTAPNIMAVSVAIDYPLGFVIHTDDGHGHGDGWFITDDLTGVTVPLALSWVSVGSDGDSVIVKIKKSMLDDTFHWHGYANSDREAVWISTDGAPGDGLTNVIPATIRNAVTEFTVPAEATADLLICYHLILTLPEGTYTATTSVIPVLP